MKIWIVFILSTLFFTVKGQDSLLNHRMDFSYISKIEKELRVYRSENKDKIKPLFNDGYRSIRDLQEIDDSLTQRGYTLAYMHNVISGADYYLDITTIDSLIISTSENSQSMDSIKTLFHEYSRMPFYSYLIGQKYCTVHSSLPTGSINDMNLIYIKEEEF